MATILRGKNKGKTVKISQWCNDWVTAEIDGNVKVFGITSLEFSPEEMYQILVKEDNGMMMQSYEKIPHQNRFRKRRKW